MLTLQALNAASEAEFAAALEGVFEHAPWVPAAAAGARPFADVAALHAGLMAVVLGAAPEVQRVFLRGHPPLSAGAVVAAGLTAESQSEQAGLGLAVLGEGAGFAAKSAEYERRFGIPFIICARRHTPESVLAALEARLGSSEAAEVAAALAEVGFITRLRLDARVAA